MILATQITFIGHVPPMLNGEGTRILMLQSGVGGKSGKRQGGCHRYVQRIFESSSAKGLKLRYSQQKYESAFFFSEKVCPLLNNTKLKLECYQFLANE